MFWRTRPTAVGSKRSDSSWKRREREDSISSDRARTTGASRASSPRSSTALMFHAVCPTSASTARETVGALAASAW